MSSPVESNTSHTPASGTKRRYLGATRRNRAREMTLFSPLSPSLTSTCSKQPGQVERMKSTRQVSEHGERSDLDRKELSRKRSCEELQADSNHHSPAGNPTQSRNSPKLVKLQTDRADDEDDRVKDENQVTGPSSNASPSLSTLHSTPIQRFPTRHSLPCSARKCLKHNNFKSPVRVQTDSSKSTETVESLAKEVEQLQQNATELQAEIASLANEGYCEEELETHIEKMHEYNELKDTGQMLMGKLALVEGVTTKDMYKRFGLDLDD